MTCADCSSSFEAKRSNTKYCPACRLYRDLIFIKDSTEECWCCESKFSPTKRGMIVCAPCGEHQYKRAHCAFCEQDDRPILMPGLAVCIHCAFAPENRKKLMRSVTQRRDNQRREAAHV